MSTSTAIPGGVAAALRSAVRGPVLLPGDAGYADARRPANAAVERRPDVLVQAAATSDVVAVVAQAARCGLSVSVRGGGHGVDGRALAGDIVLDLSALRGVVVDRANRCAIVRAGSVWNELDAATAAHGLAAPGPRVSTCGVVGSALGGGEGWLSRRYGRTAENVLSLDVVTADGRVVRASASHESELLDAMLTGVETLGAVTSLTVRLHPTPSIVTGGSLLFALADAPTVLNALAELAAGSADFAGAAVFRTAPPRAFVPGDVVGRPVLAVTPVWLGDQDDAERIIARLRSCAAPLADSVRPLRYTTLQKHGDAESGWGLRQDWTAALIDGPDARTVMTLADAAAAAPGAGWSVCLRPFGQVPDSGQWLLHANAQWADPAADAVHRAWIAGVRALTAPLEQGTAAYLHIADQDSSRATLGSADVELAAMAKRRWDPAGVFASPPSPPLAFRAAPTSMPTPAPPDHDQGDPHV